MSEINVTNGACIAFGGSNARTGEWVNGDVVNFQSVDTPSMPSEFFGWMARGVLDAADKGANWLVAGYPGPVTPDGKTVGPFNNIAGLREQESGFDLAAELDRADPAAGRLFESGFVIMNVNDGELAAHAVAARIATDKHNSAAALILGTGQGAGAVRRDATMPTVFRADRANPLETGHLTVDPMNPEVCFENLISGTAIEKHTGIDARELPANHPYWKEVGYRAGQLATYIGLMNGVELVVPTGGVGAGASDKFGPYMEDMLAIVAKRGNKPQRTFLPEVAYVDPAEAQIFELYGAGGIMADVQTRTV